MAHVLQPPKLPPEFTDENGAGWVVIDVPREGVERVLSIMLSLAAWYWASSMHDHPWLGDDALALVVKGIRYGFIPPPQDMTERVLAAARRLIEPGWLAHAGRRLFGAVGRRAAAGRITLCTHDGQSSEWCGLVWEAGGVAGADFYRLDATAADLVVEHAAANRVQRQTPAAPQASEG